MGVAYITFMKWEVAKKVEQDINGKIVWGRRLGVELDKEWFFKVEGKEKKGVYPISLSETERRSLLIGGITEGDKENEELLLQEILTEKSKWTEQDWNTVNVIRIGRRGGERPRLIKSTFESKEQADLIYRLKPTDWDSKISVRRYLSKEMRDNERIVKNIRWRKKERILPRRKVKNPKKTIWTMLIFKK